MVHAEVGTIDAKMGVAMPMHALIMEKAKQQETEKKEEKSTEKEESRCLSPSLQFEGFCFNSDRCAEVCMKESFPGGECKRDVAMRKCFCKKPC